MISCSQFPFYLKCIHIFFFLFQFVLNIIIVITITILIIIITILIIIILIIIITPGDISQCRASLNRPPLTRQNNGQCGFGITAVICVKLTFNGVCGLVDLLTRCIYILKKPEEANKSGIENKFYTHVPGTLGHLLGPPLDEQANQDIGLVSN